MRELVGAAEVTMSHFLISIKFVQIIVYQELKIKMYRLLRH